MKPIPHRPLGLIREIVERFGLNVTYCYEDLVFIEHNAFLLKMEDEPEKLSLFFNEESEADKHEEILSRLVHYGAELHLNVIFRGFYSFLASEDDQSLRLEFIEVD